jgi:serine/threonine protein kinase
VTDLLSVRDLSYVAPPAASYPTSPSSEWEAENSENRDRRSSNGLHYIICKMRHRYTPNRQGRGKFYFTGCSPEIGSASLQDKLARHAEICVRVRAHRNIASNLTCTPVGENTGWWVIDEWVGVHSLADRLENGPWPISHLPRLLLDIALGLQALHNAKVLFRELAPARVLISDLDGHAVLTDFELAKLLDASRSVSSSWPEDPFRAPEVDSAKLGDETNISIQADFYSLGKTAVAAAAGAQVDVDSPKSILNKAGVPKPISDFLIKCLNPDSEKRPESLEPLISKLNAWAKKVNS